VFGAEVTSAEASNRPETYRPARRAKPAVRRAARPGRPRPLPRWL